MRKEPIFPALLSLLVPGAGQLVNGNFGRALLFGGITVLSWFSPIAALGAIARIGTWVYSVYDAYVTASNRH